MGLLIVQGSFNCGGKCNVRNNGVCEREGCSRNRLRFFRSQEDAKHIKNNGDSIDGRTRKHGAEFFGSGLPYCVKNFGMMGFPHLIEQLESHAKNALETSERIEEKGICGN